MRLVPISQAKLVVIFDFSCLAYRVFHSKTRNQNLALMDRILVHLSPLQGVDVAVVFALDSLFLNKTAMLPHYKANRPKLEENPKEKYLWILDLLPVYQIQASGEEADDVICSFVHQNPDKKMMVVTGDSDLIHLMERPNVIVINEKSGEAWTENKHIRANFLKLSQISAFKTLFGDYSDNVKPIWPRLRRKYFEEVIWLYSHDKKKFIEKSLEVMKEKYKPSEEQMAKVKSQIYANYELVIPRFNLSLDMKEPSQSEFTIDSLTKIDPCLVFISKFLSGERTTEKIYER